MLGDLSVGKSVEAFQVLELLLLVFRGLQWLHETSLLSSLSRQASHARDGETVTFVSIRENVPALSRGGRQVHPMAGAFEKERYWARAGRAFLTRRSSIRRSRTMARRPDSIRMQPSCSRWRRPRAATSRTVPIWAARSCRVGNTITDRASADRKTKAARRDTTCWSESSPTRALSSRTLSARTWLTDSPISGCSRIR